METETEIEDATEGGPLFLIDLCLFVCIIYQFIWRYYILGNSIGYLVPVTDLAICPYTPGKQYLSLAGLKVRT